MPPRRVSLISPLSLIFSLLIFAPLPAFADCDYVNYWQFIDGTCFDLTQMSIRPVSVPKAVFSNSSVEVTNLRLQRTSVAIEVRGIVKNISEAPIRIFSISYQILDATNAPIHPGTFIVSEIVQPEQSIAISDIIMPSDLQGKSISTLKVEALSVDLRE